MWKQLIATKSPKKEWSKRKRETILKLDMCFPNAISKNYYYLNIYRTQTFMLELTEWESEPKIYRTHSHTGQKNGFLFYSREETKASHYYWLKRRKKIGKTKNIERNTCRSPLVHSTRTLCALFKHFLTSNDYISRSEWKRNCEKEEMQQENKIWNFLPKRMRRNGDYLAKANVNDETKIECKSAH